MAGVDCGRAGADPDRWSVVAAGWAQLWGGSARPAWDAVLEASGVGAGARVLDVGCGAGDLLAHLDRLGLTAAGLDPAPGMVAYARDRVPAADVRLGGAEELPWPDGFFDLVISVNALHFAQDVPAAVAEMTRVTVPAGHVAVANWAEAARNDLNALEAAVFEDSRLLARMLFPRLTRLVAGRARDTAGLMTLAGLAG